MAAIDLDMYDLKIIDVLQRQGRVSCAQIGETIGLSETACYNRLKKIEKSSVIRNYSVALNLREIGRLQTFFTFISLANDAPHELRVFERQLLTEDIVAECSYITGSQDYILRCVARDIDDYMAMIDRLREANPNIRRYETLTEVRQVKSGPVPLSELHRRDR